MSKSSANHASKRSRANRRFGFVPQPNQTSVGPVDIEIISQQRPPSRKALDFYETLQVMTLEDLKDRGLIV
ncbi:hypothetical protein [Actinomyces qiguomingii]|uniref:hypothetical protein n=1 Tax=Actinomyces qiguomingii TaxID=2057800 RepID=UPI000FFE3A3A|nr:hypothetical protein [Actinomyces qiguomingii]